MRQRHARARGQGTDETARFLVAACLVGCAMVVAAFSGLMAGSLALVAGAAHMLATAVALGLNWYARYLGASATMPLYRFDRVKPLLRYTSGLVMLGIGILLIVGAGERVLQPTPVAGWPMVTGAVLVLIATAGTTFLVFGRAGAAPTGTRLHVLADMLIAAALVAAAVTLVLSGWVLVDTLLAVLIATLLFMNAFSLIHVSAQALLDAAPAGVDRERIARDIESNVKGVATVRDVHIWSLDGTSTRATLHACLNDEVDPHAVICDIKLRLAKHHRIDHVTVEPEFGHTTGRPVGTLLH
jgi:cobalt-zinc-cadmium efflux system protein